MSFVQSDGASIRQSQDPTKVSLTSEAIHLTIPLRHRHFQNPLVPLVLTHMGVLPKARTSVNYVLAYQHVEAILVLLTSRVIHKQVHSLPDSLIFLCSYIHPQAPKKQIRKN